MADPAQGVMDAARNVNPVGAIQTAASGAINRVKQMVEPDSSDSPAVLINRPTPAERFVSQTKATDDQQLVKQYFQAHPDVARQNPLMARQLGIQVPDATQPQQPTPKTGSSESSTENFAKAIEGPIVGGAANKIISGVKASAWDILHPEQALARATSQMKAQLPAVYTFDPTPEQVAITMANLQGHVAGGEVGLAEQGAGAAAEAAKPAAAAEATPRSVTPETMYTTGKEAPGKPVGPQMTGEQLQSDTLPTAQHLEALQDNPAVSDEAKKTAAKMEPAIKDPSTGEIYDTAKSHGEVYDKMPEEAQARDDLKDGFLSPEGEFISRKEALNRVAAAQDQSASAAPQPESVGAAKLTSKRDMAEDLSVAHTMPDMIARAQETPLSKDDFYNFKIGRDVDSGHYTLQEPINMIDALRISHYAGQSVGALQDAAKAAMAAPEDATLQTAFKKQVAEVRDEILPRWSGMRHQIGLALRVLGNPTSGMRNMMLNTRDLLSEVDFSEPGKLMHALANLNPEEQTKMLQKVGQPGFMDHIANAVVAGLLGPSTAVKKAGSDAFMLMWQAAERMGGAAVSNIPGIGSGETGFASQWQWVKSLVESIPAGRQIAAASERADKPLWDAKLGFGEAAHHMLGSAGTSIEGTPLGSLYDLYGNFIHEMGGRRIIYPDQFAKYMHYNASIGAQAMDKAMAEASDAEGRDALFQHYKANPTDEMMEQAQNDARAGTFARSMNNVQFVNQMRQHWWGKLLAPFWSTGVNIGSKAAQYTGFGPLSAEWRADIAAGGPKRDMAIARQMMGMTIAGFIAHHYAIGNIEGPRPANPDLNKVWQGDGHQPYAIKLGNEKIDLGNLFEPIGNMVGQIVDISAIAQQLPQNNDPDTQSKWQRLENAGSAVVLGLANQVHNMSIFKTISDFSQIFNTNATPQQRAAFLRDMTGEAVPTVFRDMSRAWDSTGRVINSITDQLKSETPGFSKTLPPDINLFGDPAMHPLGSAGYTLDLISTPKVTAVDQSNPVHEEMYRLFRDDPNAIPPAPKAVAGRQENPMQGPNSKTGVMLSPDEQHQWKVLRGKMPDDMGFNMQDGLNYWMHQDDYTSGTDEQKKEMIGTYIAARGKMATEKMLDDNFNSLKDRVEGNYDRRTRMLQGFEANP